MTTNTFKERSAQLAELPVDQYDQQRRNVAKDLGVKLRTLDMAVEQQRKQKTATNSEGFTFEELEPWPEQVDGAALLEQASAVFRRFVVLGEREADAAALWILKTYCFDAFDTSPIFAIESATPRCGKTTMLSVCAALVSRPVTASNISTAALFRFIDAHHPTMLLDEADTWARKDENIRGILNSGHTRSGAHVIRCQGEHNDIETRCFSTWCPKLIALIGRLPATLQDRSIVILLRRKLPTEPVERYRHDKPPVEFRELRRKCLRWAQDHFDRLREFDPALPERLNDRASDNWRPLTAIADLAGGIWPERARLAASSLSGADKETVNLIELLLGDIAAFFDSQNVQRVRSQELADHLGKLPDRPWSEFNQGRPISTNQLARQLLTLGIQPKKIRFEEPLQGYERAWFDDAFARYLPSRTGTPEHPSVISDIRTSHTGTTARTVPGYSAVIPLINHACSDVPVSGEGRLHARAGDLW